MYLLCKILWLIFSNLNLEILSVQGRKAFINFSPKDLKICKTFLSLLIIWNLFLCMMWEKDSTFLFFLYMETNCLSTTLLNDPMFPQWFVMLHTDFEKVLVCIRVLNSGCILGQLAYIVPIPCSFFLWYFVVSLWISLDCSFFTYLSYLMP